MNLRTTNDWLFSFLPQALLVAVCQCCEEPYISFEDYLDIVNAQTNSVRPHWYNTLDSTEKLPGIEASNIYLYRNGSGCNTRHSRHRHVNNISNLANCPFKYIEHVDNSRLPRRLTQAVCLCEQPRQHSNTLVCKSVVNYVKVFRKEGCRYISYWEPVPVACVSISLSSLESDLLTSTRILTGE